MKKTHFKTLYIAEADEGLDEIEENEKLAQVFEFQGSKNWMLYFSKPKSKEIDFEKLFNVTICEYDMEERGEFDLRRREKDVLDFSLEHEEDGRLFLLVEGGGDREAIKERIKQAASDEELNTYGLTISHSLAEEDEKRILFDEIEARRRTLELTRETVIEFDFEESGYGYERGIDAHQEYSGY